MPGPCPARGSMTITGRWPSPKCSFGPERMTRAKRDRKIVSGDAAPAVKRDESHHVGKNKLGFVGVTSFALGKRCKVHGTPARKGSKRRDQQRPKGLVQGRHQQRPYAAETRVAASVCSSGKFFRLSGGAGLNLNCPYTQNLAGLDIQPLDGFGRTGCRPEKSRMAKTPAGADLAGVLYARVPHGRLGRRGGLKAPNIFSL